MSSQPTPLFPEAPPPLTAADFADAFNNLRHLVTDVEEMTDKLRAAYDQTRDRTPSQVLQQVQALVADVHGSGVYEEQLARARTLIEAQGETIRTLSGERDKIAQDLRHTVAGAAQSTNAVSVTSARAGALERQVYDLERQVVHLENRVHAHALMCHAVMANANWSLVEKVTFLAVLDRWEIVITRERSAETDYRVVSNTAIAAATGLSTSSVRLALTHLSLENPAGTEGPLMRESVPYGGVTERRHTYALKEGIALRDLARWGRLDKGGAS